MAISVRSPRNPINFNTSIASIQKSFFGSRKKVENLTTILSEKIARKKQGINLNYIMARRRDESAKRREREDLLEASSSGNSSISRTSFADRVVPKSAESSGKGFLGRIMEFTGTLLTGWLFTNLPVFLEGSQKLIGNISTLTDTSKKFVNTTKKLFGEFGSLLNGFALNLVTLDFTDSKGRVSSSFRDISISFNTMKDQFDEAFKLLTKGLPKIGKQYPNTTNGDIPNNEPPTTTPPTGGRSSDYWTLIAISALEDGDPQGRADVAQSIYNRSNSGKFPGGKNIRSIIIAGDGGQYQPVERAVKEFKNIKDRDSAIAAIMEADKVSKKTATKYIDDTVSAINDTTLRKNAAEYIENRTDFLGVGANPNQPSSTSLKRRNSDDNIFGNFVGPASYEYGKTKKGKASPPPETIFPKTQPSQPSQPSKKIVLPPITGDSGSSQGNKPLSVPFGPFKSGSGAVITSGRGIRDGKFHTGYDIGAAAKTPIYAYFPGVVTHVATVNSYNTGGYGNWVIWKDDIYGAYHFFGHMFSPPPVRVGLKFGRGTLMGLVGNTGVSRGNHLHWEISDTPPTSNGTFTSNEDPGSWLRRHPLPKSYLSSSISNTPQSAQIASAGTQQRLQQSQNIALQKSSGSTIIVIEEDAPPPQAQYSGGGNPMLIPIIIDPLNSYISQKLLLDLTYT